MILFAVLGFLFGIGAGLVALHVTGLLLGAAFVLGLHLLERLVTGEGLVSGVVSMLVTFFALQVGYALGIGFRAMTRTRSAQARDERADRVAGRSPGQKRRANS